MPSTTWRDCSYMTPKENLAARLCTDRPLMVNERVAMKRPCLYSSLNQSNLTQKPARASASSPLWDSCCSEDWQHRVYTYAPVLMLLHKHI